MRKLWLSVTWWSYGPKAPHCYVSVVLQSSTVEYREGEGNHTVAANPLCFLCATEAIPASQDKGASALAFYLAFIGAEPKWFRHNCNANRCLLQLLKWQLKYLNALRWFTLVPLCCAKGIPEQSHLHSVNNVLLMSWFYVALPVSEPGKGLCAQAKTQ